MSEAILISGNITGEELDMWTKKNPETAFLVMMGIADSLGFPQGEVSNNNLSGSDHHARFPDNTTLDIGTTVVAMDSRMIDKARSNAAKEAAS